MTEAASRGFVVKSSINVKSMGDPRKIAANLPHDGDKGVLGTIIGIALNVNRRSDPKGGPDYLGLTGAFAAIPTDPQREEVRSTICYLPDAVHGPIAATLEKAREADPTATVRFAMEAGVMKGGTAGFTWEFKPLFDGNQGALVDPLAQIRGAIGTGVKLLPNATDAEKAAMAAQTNVTAPSRFEKPVEAVRNEEKRGAARK